MHTQNKRINHEQHSIATCCQEDETQRKESVSDRGGMPNVMEKTAPSNNNYPEYRKFAYTPVNLTVTDTGNAYRSYAPSLYPYFGRSTYRAQLESRDMQDLRHPVDYKQDDLVGSDATPEYVSKCETRPYVRPKYSTDYQRYYSADKAHGYETTSHHQYNGTSSNRSHSLYELCAPTKRYSIASYSTTTSAGDSPDYSRAYGTSSAQSKQPRRRARSLYDTREAPTVDYQYTPKIRDRNSIAYFGSSLEMKPTSISYNRKVGDNFAYRRSLYDAEDSGSTMVSRRHSRISTKPSVKIRAYSFDRQLRETAHNEGPTYTSLLRKPYIYPIYGQTIYQDTSGNEMSEYPKSPPDASVQPVKGILKKKPVPSTSSTPTDDDSGYSSVPAMEASSTSEMKSSKGNGYFNWRTKNSVKNLGIMDRLRRRMNNNDRDMDDTTVASKDSRATTVAEERTTAALNAGSTKYGKRNLAPFSAYGSSSTTTDKDMSSIESLEKNQKPRKKKNLWNLGRRRTAEISYHSTKSPAVDNGHFSRPSSPLEKLKGFFASTPTANDTKSHAFAYSHATPSTLANRSAFTTIADSVLQYTGSAGKPNPNVYRKFSKSGVPRPHSSYASSTSRNWYEEGSFY